VENTAKISPLYIIISFFFYLTYISFSVLNYKQLGTEISIISENLYSNLNEEYFDKNIEMQDKSKTKEN
jgi:hypothetical protein